MAKIKDIKKYKIAKIITNDLKVILPQINTQLKDLERLIIKLKPYMRYKPVAKMILALNDAYNMTQDEKLVLESHYISYNKTLDNKGEVNE